MIKVRFFANENDYRPIKFPPPGPYWCTGYGEGYSVIVAYVETEEQIKEYWPEARNIDVFDRGVEPTFTSRFTRPGWYQ